MPNRLCGDGLIMKPYPFAKLSVKHKLILSITCVGGIALLFFSVLSSLNYSYSLREAMVERMSMASGSIAQQATTGLSLRSLSESGVEVPAILSKDPAVEAAVIYDIDNVAVLTYLSPDNVTHSVLPDKRAKNEDKFFRRNGKIRFQSFHPIQSNGKHLGTLAVLFNVEKLIGSIWKTIFILVLSLVVSLGVALFTVTRLQKLCIQPVQALATSVRKIIESGNLSLRLESSTQNELGDLITNFNLMLEIIQDREEQLKELPRNSKFDSGQPTNESLGRQDDRTAVMTGKNEFSTKIRHERRAPLSRLVDNHMGRIFNDSTLDVPLIGKALLVDDEPINRKVVVAILEKFGLEMEMAQNGLEALPMIESTHYALVFMDINMPEMGGCEATKLIRTLEKNSERRRATIIAMTADGAEKSQRKCFEAGMDDFLTKPIKPEILIERIAHWLGTETDKTILPPLEVKKKQPRNLPEQELWSQTRALQFVGGDKALFREIATVFIGRNDLLLQNIEAAIVRGNADDLLETAHAYKGAIGYFASPILRQSAMALEELAKNGQVDGVNEHLITLRKNSQLLCKDLYQIVSEAKSG